MFELFFIVFCSPPDGSRSIGFAGADVLAVFAATGGAEGEGAAGAAGFSAATVAVFAAVPAMSVAVAESLRTGAVSAPFVFLPFISLRTAAVSRPACTPAAFRGAEIARAAFGSADFPAAELLAAGALTLFAAARAGAALTFVLDCEAGARVFFRLA